MTREEFNLSRAVTLPFHLLVAFVSLLCDDKHRTCLIVIARSMKHRQDYETKYKKNMGVHRCRHDNCSPPDTPRFIQGSHRNYCYLLLVPSLD